MNFLLEEIYGALWSTDEQASKKKLNCRARGSAACYQKLSVPLCEHSETKLLLLQ